MLLLLGIMLPAPASAQLSGELEMEREDGATTSRIELLSGGLYALRAERTRGAGEQMDRVGIRLSGALLPLPGYVSLFVEDRADRTALGTNLELGRGPVAVGASLERDESTFAGAYLKLRSLDLEVGMGGGRNGDDWVGHGAVYLKGSGYSMVLGGAAGPGRALQHLATTWHPAVRGGGPGGMFRAQRRSGDEWSVELLLADRASFNHFASWGPYGMDQFPHEKTIEAVGDVMRYYLPPTLNQDRTLGVGTIAAEHRVRRGAAETILEARLFPARVFRRVEEPGTNAPPETEGGTGWGGYLRDDVLPSVMLGALRRFGSGSGTTLLAQVGASPVLVYAEIDLQGGEPYLLVQYRVALTR